MRERGTSNAFFHVNKGNIKFSTNSKVHLNEMESSIDSRPATADVLFVSICHPVILSQTHLVVPIRFPHTQAFYFPRSGRYLIFLLRYHLSPSVPIFPPPLLSCHCCLFPLLSPLTASRLPSVVFG